MSTDEDTELRDLVAEALESNGVLQKIRAELRSSVFLALEDQQLVKNKEPLQNPALSDFLSSRQGRQVAGLVREFLQFFDLDFTLAVFDPEVGHADRLPDRRLLMQEFHLTDVTDEKPLLLHILDNDWDKNSQSHAVQQQDAEIKAEDTTQTVSTAHRVNSRIEHIADQMTLGEPTSKNSIASIAVSHTEEIEEEVVEELSSTDVMDDKSSMDEVTSDRTISRSDKNEELDYAEDIFMT